VAGVGVHVDVPAYRRALERLGAAGAALQVCVGSGIGIGTRVGQLVEHRLVGRAVGGEPELGRQLRGRDHRVERGGRREHQLPGRRRGRDVAGRVATAGEEQEHDGKQEQTHDVTRESRFGEPSGKQTAGADAN